MAACLIVLQLKEEKFYPGLGLEPGSPALHAGALKQSYPEQVPIHDKIFLLYLSVLALGPISAPYYVLIETAHSQTLE